MNKNVQISRSRKIVSIICFIIVIFCISVVSIDFFSTSNTDIVQNTEKRVKLSTPYYDSIYCIVYQFIENEPRINLNASLKKVEVRIRLKERIDEDKIRAIGIYYHDKYLVAPFNRVYVWLYTSDMINEDKGCYATAHSDNLSLDIKLFE